MVPKTVPTGASLRPWDVSTMSILRPKNAWVTLSGTTSATRAQLRMFPKFKRASELLCAWLRSPLVHEEQNGGQSANVQEDTNATRTLRGPWTVLHQLTSKSLDLPRPQTTPGSKKINRRSTLI
eukprot:scaffold1557_cov246-Pinguiococcus_pyrenoidosus.AAC.9